MFKSLIVLLLVSSFASARQYIQCANGGTWERMVINLNGDESTFFMTNGVHLPNEQRILKDLYFLDSDSDYSRYETRDGEVRELIIIDNQYLDRALGYFNVELQMTRTSDNYSRSFELDCFSSIH